MWCVKSYTIAEEKQIVLHSSKGAQCLRSVRSRAEGMNCLVHEQLVRLQDATGHTFENMQVWCIPDTLLTLSYTLKKTYKKSSHSMNILWSFTHPHVDSNLYDFRSTMEHKRRNSEKSLCVHTMEINFLAYQHSSQYFILCSTKESHIGL